MDNVDFTSIAEELLNLVKNLQSRVSLLEKRSSKLVDSKSFYETIGDLKKRLDYLEEKIEKLNNLIDKDTINSIKNINSLKTKLEILENEYKNLIKDSDLLEVKTELVKIEKRLRSLEEYEKFDELVSEINNIKSSINVFSNEIETLKVKSIDRESLKEYASKIEYLENSLKERESKIKQILSEILNINDKLDKIETERIAVLEESINKSIYDLKTEIENIRKNIGNIDLLRNIDEDDIRRIRNLKSYEDLYSKIINLENRLNSVITSLYSIEEEIKNTLSEGYGKYSNRIKALEDRISSIEKLFNTIKSAADDIRKEIVDIRDIVVYLGKENDKLNNKIKEMEGRLKIINLDELYDTLERIKLLEMDVENIKRELSSKAGDERERIRNIEYAIKKLYERQNEILENIKRNL
ncbi:MAG: hypothetical protein BXU00_02100 [Candidatus Nanoclepta minutus]|uniref:Uncharacterized protein n=1 Tax=Candidatus Nanoclepta minutus TaxID=1940235 RepID=A0A397WMK6_9ARCH|nr:MAG: hypothetical protein BXU00_02100 [Candidatus Nanoclepta minutus]